MQTSPMSEPRPVTSGLALMTIGLCFSTIHVRYLGSLPTTFDSSYFVAKGIELYGMLTFILGLGGLVWHQSDRPRDGRPQHPLIGIGLTALVIAGACLTYVLDQGLLPTHLDSTANIALTFCLISVLQVLRIGSLSVPGIILLVWILGQEPKQA